MKVALQIMVVKMVKIKVVLITFHTRTKFYIRYTLSFLFYLFSMKMFCTLFVCYSQIFSK